MDDRARLIWPPTPGHFKKHFVRNGWRVPCRIALNEDGTWQATIDGEALTPNPDPLQAAGVADIWQGATMISESEYEWLVSVKLWARLEDPQHPCLHPRRPMAANLLKPF